MWIAIISAAVAGAGFIFLIRRLASQKLCVLMYHHIGPVADEKERKFFIGGETFGRQIDLMLANGYTPISLSQLEESYRNKEKLPSNPVLITLDDGWEDNYTYAFPILEEKRTPAVIFLSTAKISKEKNILDWAQIDEMRESGLVEFASHGANHKRLRDLSNEEIMDELTESKLSIEKYYGGNKRIISFCYPFGAVDRRVRKLVFKAGYKIDFGTRKGLNRWPWGGNYPLRRAHVFEGETDKDFLRELKRGRK